MSFLIYWGLNTCSPFNLALQVIRILMHLIRYVLSPKFTFHIPLGSSFFYPNGKSICTFNSINQINSLLYCCPKNLDRNIIMHAS